MKVSIRKITRKEEEQVVIECVEITPEIRDIHSYITAKGIELSGTTDDQHMQRFRLEDVHYFEAVDEKVFACADKQVYEIKMRLYEAETA